MGRRYHNLNVDVKVNAVPKREAVAAKASRQPELLGL
jgi:hypothetical protein